MTNVRLSDVVHRHVFGKRDRGQGQERANLSNNETLFRGYLEDSSDLVQVYLPMPFADGFRLSEPNSLRPSDAAIADNQVSHSCV